MMNSLNNILFNSKLLNFNTVLYLNVNKNLNFNFFKNHEANTIYIIFLEIEKNFNILLICSKNVINDEDKQFLFDDKINNYTKIYNFFYENKLILENIKKNNMIVLWKNQFIVSDLIDFFTDGWIENLPNNWGSYNTNLKYETELNTELFNKINKWLSNKDVKYYNEIENEKIKEILK